MLPNGNHSSNSLDHVNNNGNHDNNNNNATSNWGDKLTLSDINVGELLDMYKDDNDLLKHILVAKIQEDKVIIICIQIFLLFYSHNI